MGCCNDPATALTGTTPDPSQHVNYERGMVLGVDDFTQEFAYLAGRDQWLARDAIGYGTLSGLRVLFESDGADGPRLHVTAGSALVPSGKLVCVPSDQCAVINRWLARADKAAIVNRLLNPSSPPMSPPLSIPGVTSGVVSLYLMLCYADCKTRPVPIPGEPCRSEDELMAPSRIADDFRLDLRDRPPVQVEEDALRDFMRWLRDNIQIVDGGSPAIGDDQAWLGALRRAAQPWLTAAAASPPQPATTMFGTLGDYLFDLSPVDLQVAGDQLSDFLRVAFRFWVTELRPLWMALRCSRALLDDLDCVQLARVEFEVEWIGGSPTGVWQIVGSPAVMLVDEGTRPFLANIRLMQEWMLSLWGSEVAAMSSLAPTSSSSPAPFMVTLPPLAAPVPPQPPAPVPPAPPAPPSAAPPDAQYIVAAADALLPRAQVLGGLGAGLLMNNVAASRGTLSTAVAGTDYYAPGGNEVRIADGGTGTTVVPGDGQVLIGGGGQYTPANIAGTANQVVVANAAGGITLSTPQGIAPTSVPQFAGLIATGGVRVAVTPTNKNITLSAAHHVVLCTLKITVTLPKATGADLGRLYVIKNIGKAAVTVAANAADTVDGNKTTSVAKGEAITVVSDGSDTWHVIATAA